MDVAIRAEALAKHYGDTRALDGFDLAVEAGTVCGLLGPNGAGKTTAVRILTTLLQADGGRAEVAGHDVAAEPHQVRRAHRPVGAGAGRRRAAQRPPEPGPVRPAQPARQAGRPAPGRRAARPHGPDRRRRQGGQALLRGHAPPARPRGHAAAGPRGPVPRRAHDRARPPQPQRGVGRAPRARGGRHHRPAHHPVPRRGRPARRSGGGDRRRPRHRRRHPRAAEGRGRRRPARGRGRGPPRPGRRRRGPGPGRHRRPRGRAATPGGSASPSTAGSPRSPTVVAGLAGAGIAAADIGLRRPTLDDVFLSLTGRRADRTDEQAA